MSSRDLEKKLRICSQACGYVAIRTPAGDEGIGTCFHIGDGYYVTARHVLDGNKILEVKPFDRGYLRESELTKKVDCSRVTIHHGSDVFNAHYLRHSNLSLTDDPVFHEDEKVDVAIFHMSGIDENTPIIELPAFLDEAIGELDFLLTKAIIFGYPPIPFSRSPGLVVATAEVNAVADTRLDRFVRFILSANPRGGFSGAPALHEFGFTLGIITESLERHTSSAETGFMAVLSADTIRECMDQHDISPSCQRIEV